MAIVQRMSSDISKTEGEESEFVTLVIRSMEGIDQAKALDVLPKEIEGLKPMKDVVRLEVHTKFGQPQELIVSLKDFKTLAPDMDEVMSAARNYKGRRPGVSY